MGGPKIPTLAKTARMGHPGMLESDEDQRLKIILENIK